MCAHGEMHPTSPIHRTHPCCHTVSIQPSIMPLTPASSWCLRANRSHSCLSFHLFSKKKATNNTSKLPFPPSTSLFHNNTAAANCAKLNSGWKCLPDPCVQLVSSQEHKIWLFLPLSSLVQPQVLLSLLHFSDRLFFPPWRLAWTFQSPCSEVPRRALRRCAASVAGSSTSLQLASASLLAPQPPPEACRAGVGIPTRLWRRRSFVKMCRREIYWDLMLRSGWLDLI